MATTIELSPSELHLLCRRYLSEGQGDWLEEHNKNDNVQVLDYKLDAASEAPAGFLGRHQFLSVQVLLRNEAGGEKIELVRFFSKSAPIDIASRMDYLNEFGVFKKEVVVYRDVLPRLQQICKDVAAKCYYAHNNLLVFENLSEQGYKMAAGRDGLLNYEHLNCALKTLAALHASSIVYEVQQGDKITTLFPAAVEENAYPLGIGEDHVRRQNFNNVIRVLQEIIKELPQYKPKLEYILQQLATKMAYIFDLAQVSTKYQNVLSHGDLWANNLMYQYGKFGETPTQCRFVDFQLSRYAPPMLDVITVLTIPTSRQFRQQYLAELLSNYYRYMKEFLKREGLSIDEFIPCEQYYASAEEFRICGLIESCLFSHMTILPPTLTQQLTGTADGFQHFFGSTRVDMCMAAFRTDQIYRERMTDMVEDLVDNFVLK